MRFKRTLRYTETDSSIIVMRFRISENRFIIATSLLAIDSFVVQGSTVLKSKYEVN